MLRAARVSAFSFLIIILSGSCHVGRYFTKNFADIHDHRFFPAAALQGNDRPRELPAAERPLDTLHLGFNKEKLRLTDFLEKTKSTAFLVLYHDSLVFEWYAEGFDSTSIMPSFSVSKAVISTLVGIALDRGDIPSLDSPVTLFLDSTYHPSLQNVSFRNLLNMRADLNFKERYSSPFSPMAKYYYGKHLERYTRKLKAGDRAGKEYEYQSAATQLVGMALDNATEGNFNDYFSKAIWIPAGIGNSTSWNLDREQGSFKYFCCLNATARDFARFGLLFANEGRYGRRQVVPASWVENVYNGRNDSRDSKDYPYYLGWRQTPEGGIFAKGILGQYIYINPGTDMVVVRTGRSSKGLDWGELFSRINKTLR